jgi:catechol 2,3-dioxygenase-like lactoylglutathione lyase family enzyme
MNKTPYHATRDVIMQVPDMVKALKFYSEVLEFEHTDRSDGIEGLETGSFQLFIEAGKEPGPVFELLVPDLSVAKRELLAAGCRITEDDPQVPRLYVRDPYGPTFNLGQR